MKLSPSEIANPLWIKIARHMESRLGGHRESNDRFAMTETETARLRGRISEIKDFLQLGILENQSPSNSGEDNI